MHGSSNPPSIPRPPPPRRAPATSTSSRFQAVRPEKLPDAVANIERLLEHHEDRLSRHSQRIESNLDKIGKLDAAHNKHVDEFHTHQRLAAEKDYSRELRWGQQLSDIKLAYTTELSKLKGAIALAAFLVPLIVGIVTYLLRNK